MPGEPHGSPESRRPNVREIPDGTLGGFPLADRRAGHDDAGMDDEQPPTGAADRPRVPDPRPGDEPAGDRRPRAWAGGLPRRIGRGIATAAVVVAAVAGAGAIGVVAGLLTLFGWGAAIVVAILAVGLASAVRPRPVNGWLLVPVLALAVPAVAVAVSGARVMPQRGAMREAPTTVAEIPDKGYRAGFGDLLVDLRNLVADDGEQIVVRAGSDLGRTVVALPQNQCFNLDVRWQTGDLRLPRVHEQRTVAGFHPRNKLNMAGQQGPYHRKRFGLTRGRIALFGRAYGDNHGQWVAPTDREDAPTLTLDLTSEGGSFVIRDYPDDVAPLRSTDWPIDQVPPPSPAFVRRQELRAELARSQRKLTRTMRTQSPRAAAATTTSATVPANPAATTTTTAPPTADPTVPPDAVTRQVRPSRVVRVPTPSPPSPSQTIRSRVPRGVVMIDRSGNLTNATVREARRWRQMARRRQAFARTWAQRVVGTCNPRGTFR